MTRIWALSLWVVMVAGCRHSESLPPHPNPVPPAGASRAPARAIRIDNDGQRLRGSLITGRRGDFLLKNEKIAVAIGGVGAPQAGAMVDAAPLEGQDALRALTPVVGRSRPLPPVFDRLEIEQLGKTATIRLSGVDRRIPTVGVTHEYSLQPGSDLIQIATTIKNRGKRVLLQYHVGDRIDWGNAVPFAPGIGRAPTGTPSLVWLAGLGSGASYGYYRRGTMAGALTDRFSTVELATLEVQPGQHAMVQRWFVIGAGGQIAQLLPPILKAQGVSSGRLDITVYSDDGDSLPAELEVTVDGRPFTIGRTDARGTASLNLPSGHYKVRARARDRISPAAPVTIRRDQVTAVGLRSGPPSRLIFEVRQDGALVPAKLALNGVGGTPTPWMGPRSTPRAANTVLTATGKGALPLPPGRYRVVVSRGPQRSIHSETVDLRPHSGASIVARLKRVVSSPGYVGVDIGQRSAGSPGCGVRFEDRRLSNLAEGVAVAVTADPYPAVVQRQHGAPLTIAGLIHDSPRFGPVTFFPVPPTADDPDTLLGRPRPPSGTVVELAKARRPDLGLLSNLDFDPANANVDAVPKSVNALRVLDGRHPEDFDQLLEDWLSLLQRGRRLVATGGSDSHAIFGGEVGYPRTYVGSAPKTSNVVAALLAGKAVVSTGPFISLKVDGVEPGGTVRLPRSRRRRKPRDVTVVVTVSAAAWIGLDNLVLYVDGKAWGDPIPIPGRKEGVRLQQTVQVPVTHDTFIVALARGTAALTPVVNSTGSPIPPLALTNPVWVDTDGNGRYNPPR